jgi:gentisate 1,2-dioxygenase
MLLGTWSPQLRDILVERAVSVLTQEAAEDRFMFFELSPLVRPSGLLAALKAKAQLLHLARRADIHRRSSKS